MFLQFNILFTKVYYALIYYLIKVDCTQNLMTMINKKNDSLSMRKSDQNLIHQDYLKRELKKTDSRNYDAYKGLENASVNCKVVEISFQIFRSLDHTRNFLNFFNMNDQKLKTLLTQLLKDELDYNTIFKIASNYSEKMKKKKKKKKQEKITKEYFYDVFIELIEIIKDETIFKFL